MLNVPVWGQYASAGLTESFLLDLDGIQLRQVQAWLTKGACSLEMENSHDLEPIQGTGQWINNVDNFKRWLDSSSSGDNKGVLWLQGKPGESARTLC